LRADKRLLDVNNNKNKGRSQRAARRERKNKFGENNTTLLLHATLTSIISLSLMCKFFHECERPAVCVYVFDAFTGREMNFWHILTGYCVSRIGTLVILVNDQTMRSTSPHHRVNKRLHACTLLL
jgi:hypothetical protein